MQTETDLNLTGVRLNDISIIDEFGDDVTVYFRIRHKGYK